MSIKDETLLSKVAWEARENAIARKTKVGCAILASNNKVYFGCNIEHDFCMSIHAEKMAIANMLSTGRHSIQYLLLVAEMESFMPCGSCVDWILPFSTPVAWVGFQQTPVAEVNWKRVDTLMPHYPRK